MVIHALSCFSCVVFSTPLFVFCHFSCSVCVTNIFTQYYNHINFNWRKEFYVIYRHNITLAAAVEIYVLVNTINFIIAFKYKCRLNFWWNMETGNYLQTYTLLITPTDSTIYWYAYYRGNYNCMTFQSNTWSQETKYHDNNIHIDYSMFEGSFMFPCFMRGVIRNCKSKKDRQHKRQKDKRTNKHLQNTTHTTKDHVTWTPLNCRGSGRVENSYYAL
jgi:hypothetical protein